MFTERTVGFIQAAKATGLAGIYYAVQMANYGDLSEAEYREFGEPYDRRILAAAGDLPFNLVHLHGADVMFDLVAHIRRRRSTGTTVKRDPPWPRASSASPAR